MNNTIQKLVFLAAAVATVALSGSARAQCEGCEASSPQVDFNSSPNGTMSGTVSKTNGMCAPNCRPTQKCNYSASLTVTMNPAGTFNVTKGTNEYLTGTQPDLEETYYQGSTGYTGAGPVPVSDWKATCGNSIFGSVSVTPTGGGSGPGMAFSSTCTACTTGT